MRLVADHPPADVAATLATMPPEARARHRRLSDALVAAGFLQATADGLAKQWIDLHPDGRDVDAHR